MSSIHISVARSRGTWPHATVRWAHTAASQNYTSLCRTHVHQPQAIWWCRATTAGCRTKSRRVETALSHPNAAEAGAALHAIAWRHAMATTVEPTRGGAILLRISGWTMRWGSIPSEQLKIWRGGGKITRISAGSMAVCGYGREAGGFTQTVGNTRGVSFVAAAARCYNFLALGFKLWGCCKKIAKPKQFCSTCWRGFFLPQVLCYESYFLGHLAYYASSVRDALKGVSNESVFYCWTERKIFSCAFFF
jgi:hypothetical protein